MKIIASYSLHYRDLDDCPFGVPLKARSKSAAEREADEHLCGKLVQPDSVKIGVDVIYV